MTARKKALAVARGGGEVKSVDPHHTAGAARASTAIAPATPAICLRPREAAAALGLSLRTLWLLTNTGEVPSFKVGTCRLYSVAALTAWAMRRSEGGDE